MPYVTRTGGVVKEVSRSGTSRGAKVEFPPPPEPPANIVEYECSSEDHADFRAALAAGAFVDVTTTEAAPHVPVVVKVRKP